MDHDADVSNLAHRAPSHAIHEFPRLNTGYSSASPTMGASKPRLITGDQTSLRSPAKTLGLTKTRFTTRGLASRLTPAQAGHHYTATLLEFGDKPGRSLRYIIDAYPACCYIILALAPRLYPASSSAQKPF